MLRKLKSVMADQMTNHSYHFKCDCAFPMDFKGKITGYHIDNHEIIFHVMVDEHTTLNIGENHPDMRIEEI